MLRLSRSKTCAQTQGDTEMVYPCPACSDNLRKPSGDLTQVIHLLNQGRQGFDQIFLSRLKMLLSEVHKRKSRGMCETYSLEYHVHQGCCMSLVDDRFFDCRLAGKSGKPRLTGIIGSKQFTRNERNNIQALSHSQPSLPVLLCSECAQRVVNLHDVVRQFSL